LAPYFKAASLPLPQGIDETQALLLANAFSAQAVIYGTFFKLPLHNARTPSENNDLLVGADLQLLETDSKSIAWLYSSRFYTSQQEYMVDLARLAKEMTANMLTRQASSTSERDRDCWDKDAIVAVLKQGIQEPEIAKQPQKEKPTAQPKQSELIGQAAAFFKRLQGGGELTLHGLFDGRSSLLTTASTSSTKALVQALLAMPPQFEFVLEGHVDESKSSSDDFWVSAQQVNKLKDQLVSEHEVLGSRLHVSSKGGSQPLVPNINRKSRDRNRRIVVFAQSTK
jgi:outer membrane protein OmpA-like peptidoglycan-associated protein